MTTDATVSQRSHRAPLARRLGTPSDAFWKVVHAARTDWAMLLGALFLFLAGLGQWPVDARREARRTCRRR